MADTPAADDELDGCDIDFAADPTPDQHVPYVALFAGVAPDDVDEHARQLREVLGR